MTATPTIRRKQYTVAVYGKLSPSVDAKTWFQSTDGEDRRRTERLNAFIKRSNTRAASGKAV